MKLAKLQSDVPGRVTDQGRVEVVVSWRVTAIWRAGPVGPRAAWGDQSGTAQGGQVVAHADWADSQAPGELQGGSGPVQLDEDLRAAPTKQ